MAQRKTVISSRARPLTENDEIVISGCSGKFPNSQNFEEFSKNLYNKVNQILLYLHLHSHLIKCVELSETENKLKTPATRLKTRWCTCAWNL